MSKRIKIVLIACCILAFMLGLFKGSATGMWDYKDEKGWITEAHINKHFRIMNAKDEHRKLIERCDELLDNNEVDEDLLEEVNQFIKDKGVE